MCFASIIFINEKLLKKIKKHLISGVFTKNFYQKIKRNIVYFLATVYDDWITMPGFMTTTIESL